jgi:RHS repeat-associated protein
VLGVGAETTGASTTYYRRDSDGQLASERLASGAIYYYTFDGLGSVSALTDSGGAAQDTYTYDPYGQTSVTGSVVNPWRYTGAYQDSTGFYKMGMRYYSPGLMRWSQQDGVGPAGDPSDGNAYGYVGDNPANAVDPSGQLFGCLVLCSYAPASPTHSAGGAGDSVPSTLRSGGQALNGYTRWRDQTANDYGRAVGAIGGCVGGIVGGSQALKGFGAARVGGWIGCAAGALAGANGVSR